MWYYSYLELCNMVWCFTSLSTLLKSYPDNGRVIMKGSVQWSTISHGMNSISSWIQTCNPLIQPLSYLDPSFYRMNLPVVHRKVCLSLVLWVFLQTMATTETSKHIMYIITKTRLYNFDPLKPHFYTVKLGFTGVYIIFLISAQKHRLWVLIRTASVRQF